MSRPLETLRRALPGLALEAPLAPFCAYGVGGPAEYLLPAHSAAELVRAATLARELGLPLTVLGQATNVLVADAGLRGLVVLARNEQVTREDELVTAGAGAVLPEMVGELASQGFAGLEFAGNIPGSVGGAVVGNAGAYGRAVADTLVRVRLFDAAGERDVAPDELGFGYRTSSLKRPDAPIVLEAAFALHAGDRAALLAEIGRDLALRHRKHPLEYSTCGSFFKNPSRDVPAAVLVQEAGLKGLTLGRAQVSERHANFIVALPGATAADILAVAAEVKRRVSIQTGVELVEEVRLLGFEQAPAERP
jgi:UDP-N-acetylenolpyruvoylglucosamine reductase